ncbi:MAG TPA: exodeoxyribonuclease VII small subunit [Candidatus Krumholzibacteria bacterium]|nr:exodeoxyribonuclease VII small subunit [Candidatus Krumholzibacteria bacterium]
MKEKPNPIPPAGDDAPSFEEAMTRLERIVADLEGGRYTLEESLQRFEEGIALGNQCRRMLERADLRVRTLVEAGDRLVVSDPTETPDEEPRA